MRRVRPWLFALGLGLAAQVAHHRVLARQADAPKDTDVLYVPPPAYLRGMSFGYVEALADLLWIRALVFSGAHLGSDQLSALMRYFDGIVALAPRFPRVYLWAGITAVYGGASQIDRAMVEAAIEAYRRGVAQYPERHELLYSFGMLLITQVPATQGFSRAEVTALRNEGIELVRRAAAFGADPLVRQYAATLVAEHGTGELAIQFLESQLAQAENEDHRRMLQRKLAQLAGEEATRSVETTRRSFAAEHAARAGYVPEALYAVIRDDAAAPPK